MHDARTPACLILALASTVSAMGQQPATAPAASPAATPTVTLLDAGAAPRHTLRLAPRAGTTGVIDLTMRIKARQTVDGAESPEPPSPGVVMSFATVVKSIDGDRINYTFECVGGDLVEDPQVPAAIIDVMRGGIRMVVGLRGTGVVSDRGHSLGAEVTRTPDMDPNLQSHATAIERLLEQVPTPLPVEPVGIGGRWHVGGTIEEDGLIVQESITCTLAASDGDTAEITMDIRREAEPQQVRDPGLPEGAAVHLKAYSFGGTGRAVLRFDSLHPVDASIDVTTDSTMQMEFAGARHEVTQHMKIDTTLKKR